MSEKETVQSSDISQDLLKMIAENQSAFMAFVSKQNEPPELTIDDDRYSVIEKKIREIDALKPNKQMFFELNKMQAYKHFKGKANIYLDNFTFQIRNVANFDNPFVEMQDGDTEVRDDIAFEDGLLTINPTQVCLYRFLMLHPLNEANGGKVFRLRDVQKKRLEKFEETERQFEAYSYVRDLSEGQQKAAFLYVSDYTYAQIQDYDSKSILSEFKSICDERPNDVLALKDNPRVDITFVYSLAEAANHVYYDSVEGFIRYKNKLVMLACPSEFNPATKFADWVIENKNGKAASVYEKLKSKFSYDKLSI